MLISVFIVFILLLLINKFVNIESNFFWVFYPSVIVASLIILFFVSRADIKLFKNCFISVLDNKLIVNGCTSPLNIQEVIFPINDISSIQYGKKLGKFSTSELRKIYKSILVIKLKSGNFFEFKQFFMAVDFNSFKLVVEEAKRLNSEIEFINI